MNRSRKPFKPEKGTIYENNGGGTFECVGQARYGHIGWEANFRNVKSGWTFEARGVHRYPDGKIDWDYSVQGRFLVKGVNHEEAQTE